jgi:hypothetical protein
LRESHCLRQRGFFAPFAVFDCKRIAGLFVKVSEHKFIDAGGWMASGDGFECCLKVGVWLDAVQITGLNKRRDAGPGSATFVMAREQRVFPVEGKKALWLGVSETLGMPYSALSRNRPL